MHLPDARLENTVSVRMTLAVEIRNLRPRVVILPYWEARHPDHYRASEIGFEACFLAGLKKLDEETEPHRPHKIIYSSLYANVTPSFVVDISAQFERRMAALFCYQSQYGDSAEAVGAFSRAAGDSRTAGGHRPLLRQPDRREIRRAVRGERDHARGRHHQHGRAESLARTQPRMVVLPWHRRSCQAFVPM